MGRIIRENLIKIENKDMENFSMKTVHTTKVNGLMTSTMVMVNYSTMKNDTTMVNGKTETNMDWVKLITQMAPDLKEALTTINIMGLVYIFLLTVSYQQANGKMET